MRIMHTSPFLTQHADVRALQLLNKQSFDIVLANPPYQVIVCADMGVKTCVQPSLPSNAEQRLNKASDGVLSSLVGFEICMPRRR